MGCGCNKEKPKGGGKSFTKAVVEIVNPEKITLLRKVVIPASLGDETTIPPAVGAYRNVVLCYEASKRVYLYSSDGIPTFISTDLDAIEDELERLGVAIEDEVDARERVDEELREDISDLSEALAEETLARISGDDQINDTVSAHTLQISELSTGLNDEIDNRRNADTDLQSQIDAISASSDVKDIVGTHAELENYDTTSLGNNDIIKVLQDETQNGATTYYRWSTTTQEFTLIGEEGPYYTKSQTDSLLTGKQNTLTAGNNITITGDTISATDTTYSAGNGLSLSGTTFSADTTILQPKLTAGDNISITNNTISATDTKYTAGSGLDLTGTEFSVDNTVALKTDLPTVNNAIFTLQKNGSDVASFTANSAVDVTANITVPTDTAQLTNTAGYQTASDVASAISGKQDTLTPGNNIQINGNTISATNTTYSAGSGLDLTGTVFSADTSVLQTKLTAGDNISISNGIISSTGPTYSAGTGLELTNNVFAIDDSVVALKSDIPVISSATLVIQRNGTDVATFTTDAANPVTANILVPTNNAQLTNGAGYQTASDVQGLISGKQDTLTPGTNIQINGNTISATDTKYSAGTGLNLTGTVFSADTTVLATQSDLSGKQDTLTPGSNITITNNTISATDTTYSDFDGADASTAGTAGLVPAPAAGDQDKALKGDGTWGDFSEKFVIMKYGEANAWAKFIDAYSKNKIVYCRASSGANPATGSQTRLAFMAYVSNEANPTNVEFQYVRSVGTKTSSQPVDQVFVYKLESTNGGTWSVQIRDMAPKLASGTNASVNYSNGTYTVSATDTTYSNMTGATSGTAGAAGLVPAPAAGDNAKFLSGDGTWKTVSLYDLPIASASTLGGIKVGSGLSIDSTTGVLSATATPITLYNSTGQNTDGAMTQKAVTDALSLVDSVYSDKNTSQGDTGGAVYIGNLNSSQQEIKDPTVTDNHYKYFWALPSQNLAPYNNSVNILGRTGGNDSIALGQAIANTRYAIAIGSVAQVYGVADRGVAIGTNAIATKANSVALGAYAKTDRIGEVNVGTGTSGYGYNNTNYRIIGGVHDPVNAQDAATKNYVDTHIPTIPTNVSAFTNDAGYITNTVNNLTNYTLTSALATVATSGSYNDLSDKPSIPAAQVNSDWNASSGVAQILNKPTKLSQFTNDSGFITSYTETDPVFSASPAAGITSSDITSWDNKSDFSGDYNDLTNKPTIPTVNNATLTIQKNGTSVGTFTANASSNKSINITVPTSAADVSALPASTKYGASISVSINTTDYKITTTLKDQDGNTLGTAQVIDLPLESVVVSGSYDSTNKKIVLTLQNGNTIDIPVGDLVAGLQSEITSTNKLSSDLVDDTNHTHKFVTAAQITKLNGIAAGAEVNVQSDWDQTTTTADDYIKNKPTLATVATSGSYNDLSNKPTIPAAQVNSDWDATSGVAQILNKPTLATVATSGSYNDLSNKPTIPTVNNATLTIQKNGTTVKTFTANASSNVTANITVPTKTSDITNDSNFVASGDLATVATSGSYNDLSNKPTIPAAQVQSNWTQTTTTAVDYIKNKPTLATVATSGSYNDLSNKPTIPTKTSDLTNDSGYITDAGVTSFNGQTGAVTYTAPVTSVNGQTGTVSLSIPTKTSDLTNDGADNTSPYIERDDAQKFAIGQGSTNPVFDDMTPIRTFEWDVSDANYRPIYTIANTGLTYINLDVTVAYRITITGTNINGVVDVVDRWHNPASYPITSMFCRTLSTAAATTGLRYLRAVYPTSSYINNASYPLGQEIAMYNTTARHVKVEVFKDNSQVTWNTTKPSGSIYVSSTYNGNSVMNAYDTRGWRFRQPVQMQASGASYASYISDYEPVTVGVNDLKSSGTALAAGHMAFLAEDGKVYDISNTTQSIAMGPSKIGYMNSNVNANTVISSTYWRAITRLGATQFGYFGHDTVALGDRLFLRCTMDSNGKIHSGNYLAKSMSAGYTWMPFGYARSATTAYVDTRHPIFYTINSNGKLTHINGIQVAGSSTIASYSSGTLYLTNPT